MLGLGEVGATTKSGVTINGRPVILEYVSSEMFILSIGSARLAQMKSARYASASQQLRSGMFGHG